MDFQTLIDNQFVSPGAAAGLRSIIDDLTTESLDQIADTLLYDPLDELWEQFGDIRHCTFSNTPGAFGQFLLQQGTEQVEVSLVIAFDVTFRLVGNAYLVVVDLDAKREVQRLGFSERFSATLLQEAMQDVREFAELIAAGWTYPDPLPPAGGGVDYRTYVGEPS